MRVPSPRPCFSCNGVHLWRVSEEHGWVCRVCHPPQARVAEERTVEPREPRHLVPRLPNYAAMERAQRERQRRSGVNRTWPRTRD